MLKISDEFTCECHVLWADRFLHSKDVWYWLSATIVERDAPEEYLHSDNGSEFIAYEAQLWLVEHQIKTSTSSWVVLAKMTLWKVSTAVPRGVFESEAAMDAGRSVVIIED